VTRTFIILLTLLFSLSGPAMGEYGDFWQSSYAAKSAPGKSLLPGEGAVGTYDDLIAAGSKGDNITPHHIPSANHRAQHGVSKGDGIAINMEQPFPGSGGRHRATFTYGTQADLNLTPRQALGQGIWDARRIYQQDGLYGPGIRSSLQDVIRQNRAANPGLFDK
jgi:filamentous hemagglutinin